MEKTAKYVRGCYFCGVLLHIVNYPVLHLIRERSILTMEIMRCMHLMPKEIISNDDRSTFST
jgi:hypothetical protein